MEQTLGKRIAIYRRQKNLKQEDIAQILGVSSQAVSKWENDQTCPDISALPRLAECFGITVDELLTGEKNTVPAVQVVPEEERKPLTDMVIRIIAESSNGDKARVNLPMAIVRAAIDAGVEMPQFGGSAALQKIDWNHIMEMISHGVVGNLVEAESSDGDVVRIFVE